MLLHWQNASEFDFPALSSEEDNGLNTPMVAPVWEHVNEQAETQLTEEEEEEAVSALLSLSKSLPSENSQEDLDNSELLPIGKPTIDAAPAPICLGMDDKPSTTEVTTTTIIANPDGSVLSMTTDTMPKSLPSSPKMKGNSLRQLIWLTPWRLQIKKLQTENERNQNTEICP